MSNNIDLKQFKNGQHIQVIENGVWKDALVVYVDMLHGVQKVYAHYMPEDQNECGPYGSTNFFLASEVREPSNAKYRRLVTQLLTTFKEDLSSGGEK